MIRRAGAIALAALFALSGLLSVPVLARAAPEEDTLLITPVTQGLFRLPQTGVTLDIGYATVPAPARLVVSCAAGVCTLRATRADGVPLERFEMPVIATIPAPTGAQIALVGWPGPLDASPTTAPSPGSADGDRWLVVFDAHGLYALPAWAPLPDQIVTLGPLEHFAPDLLDPLPDFGPLRYEAALPAQRAILRRETTGDQTTTITLPTAAHAARYRDRFVPEDLSNPGGFMLLGMAAGSELPDLVRALRATLPHDPDLPAPGMLGAPLRLALPFDCTLDWVVSWGYHHSTPQNRFAVDFAALGPNGAQGQPVYAAHAGTVALKWYGTPDHAIDVGLSARVTAPDGITSTIYGHLDPAGTSAVWGLDVATLPAFTRVTVGDTDQGQVIGAVGRTGYATGPHIHFALWAWDQSLYRPVPFGPLSDFARGLTIPGGARHDCDQYFP